MKPRAVFANRRCSTDYVLSAPAMAKHSAGNGQIGTHPKSVTPKYEYSYGRQNWFDYSAAEHKAVRENVGLFDQSSFAKFRLEGAHACAILNKVCANDIDVTPWPHRLYAMAKREWRD